MKKTLGFLFLFLLGSGVKAAPWPDAPWLNRFPQLNAVASAVAFVSPYDLHFYRIMHIWKRLEQKYSNSQVNFIIVVMPEQGLPSNDELVRSILRDYNYSLPVLLDLNSNYARSWHAYVTPTVNLILADGRVTNFDPGIFDQALFEKNLQKALKENHSVLPLNREFSNDGEVKNCSHAHTLFVGGRFGKAWMPATLTLQGWTVKPLWLEGPASKVAVSELSPFRNAVGVLAEGLQNKFIRIDVTIDGSKVPQEIKGRDLQEDKQGKTFVQIKSLRMYEIISHSSKIKESGAKLTLTSDSRALKLRAIETMPPCLEVD